MGKKWYNYFVSVDETSGGGDDAGESPAENAGGAASAAQAVAEIAAAVQIQPQKVAQVVANPTSFDEIYAAAEIQAPAHGYTVYKVAEMLQSPHIKELPREIKRSSVLVALEASGVKVQELVQDAVRRDKALDTYESVQRRALERLEAQKKDENQKAQAEVDRLLAEYRARIQANNDAVEKEKTRFETWLKAKREEEQKIADTIGYFVSENPVTVGPVPDLPPASSSGSQPEKK